jgi:hypothetical protein
MRLSPSVSWLLLSPSDLLERALKVLQIDTNRKSRKWQTEQFHAHFGSDPLDLANMWYDLCSTDIEDAKLTAKEKGEKGLRMFLVAHHWLWTYPKNAKILSSRFRLYEGYCRGKPLFHWIGKLAALKAKKIVWDPRLDASDTEIFIVSIDGTDFRMQEKKHPTLPVDKGQHSHKFKHGAVKYEIAMSVHRPQCVWISGPHRGGKHDLTIFREGLKQKIEEGKLAIVDRGYVTSKPDERMLSQPNACDSKGLNNFKSRARLRQETFNGRLKFFEALQQTFRHHVDKQKLVLEAICVIVQYQMDNGSPIFDV